MNVSDIKQGVRVEITDLGDTHKFLVRHEYLDNRQLGVLGVIEGPVEGHDDEIWWVKHDNTRYKAPYHFSEITLTDEEHPKKSTGWNSDPFG